MNEIFTIEQVNLMCIFDTSSRTKLISEIVGEMKSFDDEMLDIAVAVVYKLDEISDEDFSALELYPVTEEYDEEV
jgi:hypothetical protein